GHHADLEREPGEAAADGPEPDPRPERPGPQRLVPGERVEPGPGPAGALLDDLAGRARHVLVGADPRIDHGPVAEPADLHGQVAVLAVHALRVAAGQDDRVAPERGERARADHDAVDHALAEPGEAELERGLQPPQPVEPGHGVSPGLLHRADRADL